MQDLIVVVAAVVVAAAAVAAVVVVVVAGKQPAADAMWTHWLATSRQGMPERVKQLCLHWSAGTLRERTKDTFFSLSDLKRAVEIR